MIVLSLLVQSCFCWGVACFFYVSREHVRSVQGAGPRDLLTRCTFLAQCGPSQSTGRRDTGDRAGGFWKTRRNTVTTVTTRSLDVMSVFRWFHTLTWDWRINRNQVSIVACSCVDIQSSMDINGLLPNKNVWGLVK